MRRVAAREALPYLGPMPPDGSAPQPVTGLRAGDVAQHVFLCGDPDRVARMTRRWSDAREVAGVREFRVATGVFEGLRVSAASTGVGAPGAALVIEELATVGAHTLLRVGNSGGLAPGLELGDLVVTTGAVRDDGTSRSYVDVAYPAVADWRIVAALVATARARGARCHAGITWSFDAFYVRNACLASDGSLTSMGHRSYWTRAHGDAIRAMQAAGVLNCEMEAGALLTLAGLLGLRAGCVCVVSDRTPWVGPSALDLDRNMEACIDVAHEAMLRLAAEEP